MRFQGFLGDTGPVGVAANAGMEPPNELEQENAALLAEHAALKRKVRALEDDNAVVKARRVLLERRLAQAATGGSG
jgi:cell division protein FtsB